MKKIVSVFCIFTFIFSAICAKPKYISPNNDGVQDELEIPLQISDKRYVQGWSLVIMNEQKEVVRVIENKVSFCFNAFSKISLLIFSSFAVFNFKEFKFSFVASIARPFEIKTFKLEF